VNEELLDLCDWSHRVASLAMFGASQTGAAQESHDLWITHCGFPEKAFNCAFLKRPGDGVAAAIEATERYFEGVDLPFSILCRSDHAGPCSDALEAAGYTRGEEIPVMVLDPIPDGGRAIEGLEVTCVEGPDDLATFQKTAFQGFGLPEQAGHLFLTEQLHGLPNVQLYLGRIEGEGVCTSLVFVAGTVASIYWVATHEGHRSRGLGEAITWAAVAAGRDLGCRLAVLQASTMGAPVYARMGFETVAHYVRFERSDSRRGTGLIS
jgi:GNAT superfamily N-acetyltransferase